MLQSRRDRKTRKQTDALTDKYDSRYLQIHLKLKISLFFHSRIKSFDVSRLKITFEAADVLDSCRTLDGKSTHRTTISTLRTNSHGPKWV